MESSIKIALETALDLASDRLDLIEQREPDERDRVEERKLKACLKVLHNKLLEHKEDVALYDQAVENARLYVEEKTERKTK